MDLTVKSTDTVGLVRVNSLDPGLSEFRVETGRLTGTKSEDKPLSVSYILCNKHINLFE